jgi:hypothetical protein
MLVSKQELFSTSSTSGLLVCCLDDITWFKDEAERIASSAPDGVVSLRVHITSNSGNTGTPLPLSSSASTTPEHRESSEIKEEEAVGSMTKASLNLNVASVYGRPSLGQIVEQAVKRPGRISVCGKWKSMFFLFPNP